MAKDKFHVYIITNKMKIVRSIISDDNIVSNDKTFCTEKDRYKGIPNIIINQFNGGWISPWQYNYATGHNIPLVYFMWESPLYPNHQEPYLSKLGDVYDYIITWDDDIIDNKKFFRHKFNFLKNIRYDIPLATEDEFNKKKLFTMICSNFSTLGTENKLYAERKNIIDYFERNHIGLFMFYGRGWDGGIYKNYRGSPTDKCRVYKHYKFAFCFENYEGRAGYITEKILDCFIAGIVPIYHGSKNIADYIPEDTFIRFDDFDSLEDLIAYVSKINYTDYIKFQNNISNYLNSDEKNIFTNETFEKNYKANLLQFVKTKTKKKTIAHRLKVTWHLIHQLKFKRNRHCVFIAWLGGRSASTKKIFLMFLKWLSTVVTILMQVFKANCLSRIRAICATLSHAIM